MPTVDVRNEPIVVEFAPEAQVVEFTEAAITAQVVVGPTVVEFSWGTLVPEAGLAGGGVFNGQVPIRPDIPSLPVGAEAVDPATDYIMLYDASLNKHVRVLAALGGGGGGGGDWNGGLVTNETTFRMADIDRLRIGTYGTLVGDIIDDEGGWALQVGTGGLRLAQSTGLGALWLSGDSGDGRNAIISAGDADSFFDLYSGPTTIPAISMQANDQGGAHSKFGGAAYTRVSDLTSGTTVTVDCEFSNEFRITLAHNVSTLTLTNPNDGQTINIRFKQDGSGSRLITWPASFIWPGGVKPTLSTAINAVDRLVASYVLADDKWDCSLLKGLA